jgi:hypothetical protein
MALQDLGRRKPHLANPAPPEIEALTVALSLAPPACGRVRITGALRRWGLALSPAGVRSPWQRHDTETVKKRRKTLEAKSAREGIVRTKSEPAAMEKATIGGEAHGAFESEGPFCRDARNTFCVGNMTGAGRIHWQTFVDTCATVAFAKLQNRKTPIIAADLPNDRVVEVFDAHAVKRCRVMTDRGTAFCGNPERRNLMLCPAVEDIDHARTKTKGLQTDGIVDRFHETVLDAFHRVTVRRTIHRSIDALRGDLDAWIGSRDETREHQGRWCFGRTPMQTFNDARPLAQEKPISA